MALTFLPSGFLHQNASHRFRRGSKEVAAIVKVLIARQAQIHLVHQGRRLQRLPRLLLGEPLSR